MDGRLRKKNRYIKLFDIWMNEIQIQKKTEFFCEDRHIDYFDKKIVKENWLIDSFEIYRTIKDHMRDTYPKLKIMLGFQINSKKRKNQIPKLLTKSNFKYVQAPPNIFVCNSEIENVLFAGSLYLDSISKQFGMEAYYYEEEDDVIWRTIYLFDK